MINQNGRLVSEGIPVDPKDAYFTLDMEPDYKTELELEVEKVRKQLEAQIEEETIE